MEIFVIVIASMFLLFGASFIENRMVDAKIKRTLKKFEEDIRRLEGYDD